MKGVRKKEDPYNASKFKTKVLGGYWFADFLCLIVIAGFFTGGALAIRGGRRSALNSAIACGCLLAVIEGVGIGFQRMMADNTKLEVSLENNRIEKVC